MLERLAAGEIRAVAIDTAIKQVQRIVGALAATAFSLGFRTLPDWLLVPLTMLAGFAAGAWSERKVRVPSLPLLRKDMLLTCRT